MERYELKRLRRNLWNIFIVLPLAWLALLIIMGIGFARDRKSKREQGRFEA
jgi:Na+/proline symporter